ncbi:unnamed protein product [Meloidogyne enterolobii]|uniref:Uncharacterized protein n=1 Tax=Meloidogyne enterolobii TaxID=390850 RepID=A0ACB1B9E8_MELEN
MSYYLHIRIFHPRISLVPPMKPLFSGIAGSSTIPTNMYELAPYDFLIIGDLG